MPVASAAAAAAAAATGTGTGSIAAAADHRREMAIRRPLQVQESFEQSTVNTTSSSSNDNNNRDQDFMGETRDDTFAQIPDNMKRTLSRRVGFTKHIYET